MKPEQRLLLALSLTLGILLAWSAMVGPPPAPPGAAPSLRQAEAEAKKPLAPHLPEPLKEFHLASWRFGLGEASGAVKTIWAGGAPLLVESNPGLFQLRSAKRGIPLTTQPQEDGLTSEGFLDGGIKLTRRWLPDKSHNYLINIELSAKNTTPQPHSFSLELSVYQPLYLKDPREQPYQEGLFFSQEKSHRFRVGAGESKEFPGSPRFVTAQGKSKVMVVKPRDPAGMFHVEHPAGQAAAGWIILPETKLSPGEEKSWSFLLYAGPMNLNLLREAQLEEAVGFGAFSWIAKLLLEVLSASEQVLHNYGLAILFLSIAIWLLFFPFTWSSIRMMRVMGQIQPQVERLRKEHAKNPQRLNKEILELYRKHRVNPLSGCLPLLLQMPIFVALYQVLTRCAQLEGAGFLWIKDLSAPDALIRFPSRIPLMGESLNLLPLLMVGAMFLQQRMSKGTQGGAVTPEQQMQQKLFQWFPILFGFMFYSLPSGLVLYWVTNTLLTIGQQMAMLRLHR